MPSDNLETRVTALEAQVNKLNERVRAGERDAAAARILAGAADRDVDEFRTELRELRTESRTELRDFRQATTASFNALRADLTDLRGYVNNRFDQVDNGFIEIRSKLDTTTAGQQRIVELLERLPPDQG